MRGRCAVKEILELCVRLDESAQKTYVTLAECCTEGDLKRTFEQLAKEETTHVQWWSELLSAWEGGLIPPVDDRTDLLESLQETAEQIELTLAGGLEDLSNDEMLDLAAQLEFYLLDPIFGELLDLVDPGGAEHHRDAYWRHVMRLVDAIETHYSRKNLAHFLARVLARSYRDQQRLSTLATHDALTGVYNRRGFYGYLSQWGAWSSRYGHPLGVLLIDIDYFKVVNDSLGHPAGDDALRAIASALSAAVRSSDLVGRYGGDEFAILAPETPVDELAELAQRVLELVRSSRFAAGAQDVGLSVSIGSAYMSGSQSVSPESILAAADSSLYEAKRAGRDRAGAPIDTSEFGA